MHIDNQMVVFEIIQEFYDLLNSFMMKQATSHLGPWSDLINNESNNGCWIVHDEHLHSSRRLKYDILE
jgi:predicted HNH restriction endonuclease